MGNRNNKFNSANNDSSFRGGGYRNSGPYDRYSPPEDDFFGRDEEKSRRKNRHADKQRRKRGQDDYEDRDW